MKKLSTLLILLTIALTLQAQTDRGNIFVGANSNVSFRSTNLDDVPDNNNSLNIGANAGYFLIDNLTLGFWFDYSNTSVQSVTTTNTAIGPFATCCP